MKIDNEFKNLLEQLRKAVVKSVKAEATAIANTNAKGKARAKTVKLYSSYQGNMIGLHSLN